MARALKLFYTTSGLFWRTEGGGSRGQEGVQCVGKGKGAVTGGMVG